MATDLPVSVTCDISGRQPCCQRFIGYVLFDIADRNRANAVVQACRRLRTVGLADKCGRKSLAGSSFDVTVRLPRITCPAQSDRASSGCSCEPGTSIRSTDCRRTGSGPPVPPRSHHRSGRRFRQSVLTRCSGASLSGSRARNFEKLQWVLGHVGLRRLPQRLDQRAQFSRLGFHYPELRQERSIVIENSAHPIRCRLLRRAA